MNSRRPKDQLDVLKAVSPEYSYDPNGAGAQQIGMQLNQQNVYKIGNETIYGIDPETAQICNQLLALPKKEFLKYMTDLSFSCAQNRGENVTIEHIGSLVEKSMGSSWTPENEKIEAENELNRLVYGDDWRKEIEKIKRGEPVGDEIINAEITPDGIEPPVENIEIEKESEDSDNAE